jgi:hypothetical protein
MENGTCISGGKCQFVTVLLTSIDEGDDWIENVAHSQTMTIDFSSGNEPRWSVKMAGSREAMKSFRSCLRLLGENETSDPQATSPVPEDRDTPFPGPAKPVPTVPIKKPMSAPI